MKYLIRVMIVIILLIFVIDLNSQNDPINLNPLSSNVSNNDTNVNYDIYDHSFAYVLSDDLINDLNINLNECNRLNEIVGNIAREQNNLELEWLFTYKKWLENDQSTSNLKQSKADLIDESYSYIKEIIKRYTLIDVTLYQYPVCFDEEKIGNLYWTEMGRVQNIDGINMYTSIQRNQFNLSSDRTYFSGMLSMMLQNTEYEPLFNRSITHDELLDN